jgi:hypothetical protein
MFDAPDSDVSSVQQAMALQIFSLSPESTLGLATCSAPDGRLVVTIQRYATEAEAEAFMQIVLNPTKGIH